MRLLKFHTKRIKSFDPVLQARLLAMSLFMFNIQIISPVGAELKGKFLTAFDFQPAFWIAIFSILYILSNKLSTYLIKRVKYSNIMKWVIFTDFIWGIGSLSYFYDVHIFVWVSATIGLLDSIVYSTLMLANSNYVHYFHPKDFKRFNNYKVHLVSEVSVIGLIVSAIIISNFGIATSIIVSSILSLILVIVQLNFLERYKKNDFKFLLKLNKDKDV